MKRNKRSFHPSPSGRLSVVTVLSICTVLAFLLLQRDIGVHLKGLCTSCVDAPYFFFPTISSRTISRSKIGYGFEDVFLFANDTVRPAVPKGMPSEEDWLLDNNATLVAFETGEPDRPIPRKLFKVNILTDGYLEPLFARDPASLNMSAEEDLRLFSLQQAHLSWKEKNPGYSIHYFDLISCRRYIRQHFHPVILRAFDCINAFAGKCDFFRYLVLFREGGWYSDWKEVCLVDSLLDKLSANGTTWVSFVDSTYRSTAHNPAFYGASPRHPAVSRSIFKILENVQSKHYGKGALETTGPILFGGALKDAGVFKEDLGRGIKVGLYNYGDNMTYFYHDEPIVKHKCEGCG
jgi:Glycosyltransferase sugar-binding region containing DXD motif